MHEWSIARSLRARVEREAHVRGALAVRRLQVRIGELSGVEAELLAFAWETVREEGVCAGATLDIERVELCWRCRGCGCDVPPDRGFRCEGCGLPAELERGDELQLERIEMEIADRYARGVEDSELQRRFEKAMERDRASELEAVILEVANEAHDRSWAEACCVRLARHRNARVRGSALAGFGHLARRFGQLDRRRVHRLVEVGLHAHHEYEREQAESAVADLEAYLAWRFERPPA